MFQILKKYNSDNSILPSLDKKVIFMNDICNIRVKWTHTHAFIGY